jgi:small-conductance mechanosensitive channel
MPELIFTLPIVGVVDVTALVFATGLFAAITLFFFVVQTVVLARLRALSKITTTDIDDVLVAAVSSVRPGVYTVVALYVALQLFTFPDWADTTLTAIFLVVVVWQLIAVASQFINYGARRLLEKDEDGDGVVDPNAATAADLAVLLGRIVLWVFGIIFILSNLGIEVLSLVAGLGIGGIAVAFALQGILSDLFSSFSLYMDKPFRIGDFIVVGEHSGTVEKIGIKTTRLRTLQGEELVVSNSELTTARVQNFKRMEERRIVFTFGVTYDTTPDTLRQIDSMVSDIISNVDGARFDRSHFTSFGDSALMFEVVYHVESSDYAKYMDIQETVNLTLAERFAAEGIEFAYPTQTIYVKQ